MSEGICAPSHVWVNYFPIALQGTDMEPKCPNACLFFRRVPCSGVKGNQQAIRRRLVSPNSETWRASSTPGTRASNAKKNAHYALGPILGVDGDKSQKRATTFSGFLVSNEKRRPGTRGGPFWFAAPKPHGVKVGVFERQGFL